MGNGQLGIWMPYYGKEMNIFSVFLFVFKHVDSGAINGD